jgi:hypothetical protein
VLGITVSCDFMSLFADGIFFCFDNAGLFIRRAVLIDVCYFYIFTCLAHRDVVHQILLILVYQIIKRYIFSQLRILGVAMSDSLTASRSKP